MSLDLLSPLNPVIAKLDADPARREAHWCMPTDACKLLYLLATLRGATSMLEIGTSIGYSTLWLALAAQKTGGTVQTIDAFDTRQSQAKAHAEEAGLSKHIQWHLGDALTTIQQLLADSKTFDLVFIDAAKKEYLDYFNTLHPSIVPGGLIIADNTQSHRTEMQPFVDAILSHPDYLACDIDTPNGLIVAQKRSPQA